jgi:23S rRNA (guanosine2251-2'-O)-methyltransferase
MVCWEVVVVSIGRGIFNAVREIILIVHNVRSAHNVGSLLRTADGLGLKTVYLTGYTPYPELIGDTRLPHIKNKLGRQIHKTALGAEKNLTITQSTSILAVMGKLKSDGYSLVALEQTPQAKGLNQFKPTFKTALVVGNEVDGLESEVLKRADFHIQIPMRGSKESFNVSVAAAIALYQLTTAT